MRLMPMEQVEVMVEIQVSAQLWHGGAQAAAAVPVVQTLPLEEGLEEADGWMRPQGRALVAVHFLELGGQRMVVEAVAVILLGILVVMELEVGFTMQASQVVVPLLLVMEVMEVRQQEPGYWFVEEVLEVEDHNLPRIVPGPMVLMPTLRLMDLAVAVVGEEMNIPVAPHIQLVAPEEMEWMAQSS